MSGILGSSQTVLKADGSTKDIAVASTAVVYTRSFPLYWATFFGIWVRATSATGTPDVMIELQESYKEPTTEGSAEASLWVEPDGFANVFDSIADENAHIKTITPVPMKYGRYKITGNAANPADSIVNIENFLQEMIG